MSLVVESISVATARIRSRKFPESSRWCRKSSNCFSSLSEVGEGGAWASPSGAVVIDVAELREQQRIELSPATVTFLGMELEMRGNLGGENSERDKQREMGLGFKEEDERDTEIAAKAAFLTPISCCTTIHILVGSWQLHSSRLLVLDE